MPHIVDAPSLHSHPATAVVDLAPVLPVLNRFQALEREMCGHLLGRQSLNR